MFAFSCDGVVGEQGAYLATSGAMALQGPHHVAKASRTTIGFLAMVSLKPSRLWQGWLAGQEKQMARRGRPRAQRGRGKKTHVSMLWIVILGRDVWKLREARKRGAVAAERRAGLRTRIGLNGIGVSSSRTARDSESYRIDRCGWRVT